MVSSEWFGAVIFAKSWQMPYLCGFTLLWFALEFMSIVSYSISHNIEVYSRYSPEGMDRRWVEGAVAALCAVCQLLIVNCLRLAKGHKREGDAPTASPWEHVSLCSSPQEAIPWPPRHQAHWPSTYRSSMLRCMQSKHACERSLADACCCGGNGGGGDVGGAGGAGGGGGTDGGCRRGCLSACAAESAGAS